MLLKLFTKIGKIQNIPNAKNIAIVNEFLEYMRSNGSAEHHQNNNFKNNKWPMRYHHSSPLSN